MQSAAETRHRPFSISAKFCRSVRMSANVPHAAIAATVPTISAAARLSMDQWPRVFEVLVADRRRRPERQRGDGARRIVAGILRKGAGAEHEQVRDVPALQITVERAGFGIAPHDCAAV